MANVTYLVYRSSIHLKSDERSPYLARWGWIYSGALAWEIQRSGSWSESILPLFSWLEELYWAAVSSLSLYKWIIITSPDSHWKNYASFSRRLSGGMSWVWWRDSHMSWGSILYHGLNRGIITLVWKRGTDALWEIWMKIKIWREICVRECKNTILYH